MVSVTRFDCGSNYHNSLVVRHILFCKSTGVLVAMFCKPISVISTCLTLLGIDDLYLPRGKVKG